MATPEGYGAQSVHYDQVLTNYSVACFNDSSNFIAHRIFPRVNVKHLSDKFDYYPAGYFMRINDERRAEEAVANRVNYNVSRKAYICEDYALRTFISDKKRANVDSQRQLDTEATRLVVESMKTAAEARFVKQFLTTGQWGADWTGAAATSISAREFMKFSDEASDPIKLFKELSKDMLLRGLRRPNTAIITRDVWDVLTEHPDIMDRIKFGGTPNAPAKISAAAVAALLELDRIEIMDSVYNAAPDGVVDENGLPPTEYQFLAQNKILLMNLDMRTGTMSANAAVTFVPNWLGAGTNGAPVIRKYRESEAVRGEWIEGEWAYDQRIVCPDLGILLSDVI